MTMWNWFITKVTKGAALATFVALPVVWIGGESFIAVWIFVTFLGFIFCDPEN